MTDPRGDAPERGAPSPVVVDLLLAAGVALAIALIIAAGQGGERQPDPVAFGFSAAFGAVMLLRRRAPLTVLALTVLGLFGYYALGYPPIGVAIPVVAALFAAADAGRAWWAIAAGVVVFSVSFAFRLADGEPAAFLLGYEAVTNIALISAAVALGDGVRARRVGAAREARILDLTAESVRRETEDRMRSERERLSRDLHDTLGHTMSVIALHAGVAGQELRPGQRAAAEALDRIRQASSRALEDLRWIVRLLRTNSDDDRQALSLDSITDLVEATRAAGVAVTAVVDRSDGRFPPPVEAAAFRIVQEALTNVVRHAGARSASVVVAFGPEGLSVEVDDDGSGDGSGGDLRSGHGLIGASERARLLGGTFDAGARPGGGFAVRALLPGTLPS